MDSAEPPRCWGGARRMSLPEGQRIVITGLSLVIDPASAAVALPPQLVHVWAEAGHGAQAIGKLSPGNPIAPVRPPVELGGDGEFVLFHDSTWSTVRLHGYYVGRPNPDGEGEPPSTGRRTRFLEDIREEEVPDGEEGDILSEEVPDDDDDMYAEQVPGVEDDDAYAEEMPEEEEEERERVEYEPLTEEDMAERYDSDNGEDDDEEEDRHPCKACDKEAAAESSSKARNSTALVGALGGVVVPDGEFLGPPRFAGVKNTAGFMRIAAADAGNQDEGNKNNKEILVLYRYTRFSRTWSGRRGVEACRRTKLHWLRFAVPPAGDMESALAWAGSSLGPLIYPRLFRRELKDLWSSLLVAAAVNTNTIPSQATRLHVVVDVGILRREDYTVERMGHMRGALEATTGEAWPEYYHVGMELHLPEPVTQREVGRDEDNVDGARQAKRRRVAIEDGEECSVCLDTMESGLAAWPGCGHVFHGQCMELTLAEIATCPLCRHDLCSGALVS